MVKRILMNKSELVKAIHDQQTSLSRRSVGEVVDIALDLIAETVAKGGEVGLVGFGKFRPVRRKSRNARNPATGESVTISERVVPRFTAGKSFRERVDSGMDSSLRDRS